LQFVSEDPGVGQFDDIIDATMLSDTVASPLASTADQHRSATITELPRSANVPKKAERHGG
jgi:hypothetical protein